MAAVPLCPSGTGNGQFVITQGQPVLVFLVFGVYLNVKKIPLTQVIKAWDAC